MITYNGLYKKDRKIFEKEAKKILQTPVKLSRNIWTNFGTLNIQTKDEEYRNLPNELVEFINALKRLKKN